MSYTLYSGAGNTFALLQKPISSTQAALLSETCDVDGVIFGDPEFKMRIFNRDGSEAEMCGNGLRCYIQFLRDNGIYRDVYTIETLAGTHRAWFEEDQIAVQMPPPTDIRWNLSLARYTVHHLNTGVPHAVVFVDSLDTLDINKEAFPIRHHPTFPKGANVNFVEYPTLRIRTYERGVEDETLACGTGATAAALAAAKLYSLPPPISIQVASKEHLEIGFNKEWSLITMKGPVKRGDIKIKNPLFK